MELTTEQKARVFAQYYGCDTQVVTSIDSETGMPSHGAITGIYEGTQVELQLVEGRHLAERPEYFDFDVVALVLRPISAITDAEYEDLAILVGTEPHAGSYVIEALKAMLADFALGFDSILEEYSLYLDAYTMLCVIDQLRSIGIDLPVFIAPGHPDNGKTAIELGLAIAAE